jgi:hypothetical protein
MDNLMYTSVCHDSRGPPARRRGWRSDCHLEWSNHLQESRCGTAMRAAYCYDGGGHHRRPVTDMCRLVRTATVQ